MGRRLASSSSCPSATHSASNKSSRPTGEVGRKRNIVYTFKHHSSYNLPKGVFLSPNARGAALEHQGRLGLSTTEMQSSIVAVLEDWYFGIDPQRATPLGFYEWLDQKGLTTRKEWFTINGIVHEWNQVVIVKMGSDGAEYALEQAKREGKIALLAGARATMRFPNNPDHFQYPDGTLSDANETRDVWGVSHFTTTWRE